MVLLGVGYSEVCPCTSPPEVSYVGLRSGKEFLDPIQSSSHINRLRQLKILEPLIPSWQSPLYCSRSAVMAANHCPLYCWPFKSPDDFYHLWADMHHNNNKCMRVFLMISYQMKRCISARLNRSENVTYFHYYKLVTISAIEFIEIHKNNSQVCLCSCHWSECIFLN